MLMMYGIYVLSVPLNVHNQFHHTFVWNFQQQNWPFWWVFTMIQALLHMYILSTFILILIRSAKDTLAYSFCEFMEAITLGELKEVLFWGAQGMSPSVKYLSCGFSSMRTLSSILSTYRVENWGIWLSACACNSSARESEADRSLWLISQLA